ncbi:NADH:flavin oxidoreductase/NADH oxidase [Trametes elegans]|nr:NADH:flavin oxidoreductase/NADH oxidase [Trametes elegans]
MTTSDGSAPKLFQPITVGDLTLAHRVVLAPLTRCRANPGHVPNDLAVEYYAQRASVPGTLLISEGTFIAAQAGGLSFSNTTIPGIWSEEQVAAWKRIVDAVHGRGSYIYMQLWALGRAAVLDALKEDGPGFSCVSASAVPLKNRKDTPRPLTVEEIKEYAELYAKAASNAVHGAGFDGVELHGANGYLIDQFLQDISNQRTDAYGGSVENRARFALEVIEAVSNAIGIKKTGLRISPWSLFQGMRMEDPIPTFSHLITRLREQFPGFAYLHVVEPGILGPFDAEHRKGDSNDFARELWLPRPLISAGRYTRESAIARAEKTGELIAFGRLFISNPDLPLRLRENLPLTPWNHDLFYTQGPDGYVDYPFSEKLGAAHL